MYIRSHAFEDGAQIPQKYTCEGAGVNPPLTFGDVPEEAISLVLIMDDPDVPESVRKDRMWDHWVVWNIDPSTSTVAEGEKMEGIYGITTSGTLAYVPPCPPDREHQYRFYLYALDVELNLQKGATKRDVLVAMKGHIIEEAVIKGCYCKGENKK